MITAQTNRQIVEGYCHSVLSGTIVAGELVRAAVERHCRDLEKVKSDDYLYDFDYAAAKRACMFFPAGLRHSSGEWSGHPFHLSDWQQFIIWSLFGWKRKADGFRRYRKAYISLGRKNGKSVLAAGVALFLLVADGEHGAQVFVGATKHEQACIVYGEAERMVRASPGLKKHCQIHKNNISLPATNSFFRPVSSDKPYDGTGPHGVIFDELHAYREVHRPFYETMISGSASRRQPLQLIITTAGNDKSLLWKEENDFVANVVTGVLEDDSVFGYIACLDKDDDPFDEAHWPKANPNLGISVKLDYLRERARDAVHKPTSKSILVRYHCNQEVSSVEDAVTKELWDSAEGELSDWKTADCIGAGVDLGGRDDLAGSALCARFVHSETDEGIVWRYELRTRGYLASGTNRDLKQQPWSQWIHDERITISDNLIGQLRDELLDDAKVFGVPTVAFDPYNARQLGDDLEAAGMDAATMPQNHGQFNEPIREFLSALKDGRMRHNGDPVLRWCMLNMAINQSPRGQWMADKGHSKEKIDIAVASLMAFREAMFGTSRPKSKPYSSAGTGVW